MQTKNKIIERLDYAIKCLEEMETIHELSHTNWENMRGVVKDIKEMVNEINLKG